MSYNYGPNYLSMIQALQSGGLEGASALKQARVSRGLAGRGIDTQKVSDSEVESAQKKLLKRFSDVREENDSTKAKYTSLIEGLGEKDIDVDPVTSEIDTEPKLSLTERLYGKKGVQAGEPASQSYFNLEILDRPFKGNSRKAGDISLDQQEKIMEMIINTGRQQGMSNREIALTLATVRFESGFNPDAAAKSSSATGLGQFINDTGEKYGLTDENRWDVAMQVQAVVDHTLDNIEMANKKGYGEEYIYALHHDGPALDSGGLDLSKKEVMPYVDAYEQMLENY